MFLLLTEALVDKWFIKYTFWRKLTGEYLKCNIFVYFVKGMNTGKNIFSCKTS